MSGYGFRRRGIRDLHHLPLCWERNDSSGLAAMARETSECLQQCISARIGFWPGMAPLESERSDSAPPRNGSGPAGPRPKGRRENRPGRVDSSHQPLDVGSRARQKVDFTSVIIQRIDHGS
jgi:hypothetical protein